MYFILVFNYAPPVVEKKEGDAAAPDDKQTP